MPEVFPTSARAKVERTPFRLSWALYELISLHAFEVHNCLTSSCQAPVHEAVGFFKGGKGVLPVGKVDVAPEGNLQEAGAVGEAFFHLR